MDLKIENIAAQPTKIKVVGIGGAGGNAINRMLNYIEGVELIAINTDVQDLDKSNAHMKIQIGEKATGGLGTGANPELGKASATESSEILTEHIRGAHMVFITAGMGGGTGTGASPVLAEIAKGMEILTVAVITKPFLFEGRVRNRQAEEGISQLKEICDTVIVIPNDKLFHLYDAENEDITVQEAFFEADTILRDGVNAISSLITKKGLINLDFKDVETVMKGQGEAILGIGIAHGENKALEAVEQALNSPFLDSYDLRDAKCVLVNITGPKGIKLKDTNIILSKIYEIGSEANIVYGISEDDNMSDELKVTLIVTGFTRVSPAKKTFSKTQAFSFDDYMTNIQEKQKTNQSNVPNFVESKEEDDDFDIPAFLKKKIN